MAEKDKDKIKALTFNAFGTLFEIEKSMLPYIGSIFKRHGYNVSSDDFIKIWRQKQIEYAMMNTLLLKGHVKFNEIIKRSLITTFKKFGIKAKDEDIRSLTESWGNLNPYPDVKSTLMTLKLKFMIAILSVGDKELLNRLASKINIGFNHIISAEDAGVFKPHPTIYSVALHKLNLKPEEVAHVSAHAFDVTGASAAGLVTVWVNRYDEEFEETGYKPDFIVKDIKSIADLFI